MNAAINIGVRNLVDLVEPSCKVAQFRITGQSPMARVASYASVRFDIPAPQATDDHIVEMVHDDVFTVRVVPLKGGNTPPTYFTGGSLSVPIGGNADYEVGHVVIRPHGEKRGGGTVQPITLGVTESKSEFNLFDTSEGQVLVATFASADVLVIAEDNDVQVVLLTPREDIKCNLDDTRILRGYNLSLRDD